VKSASFLVITAVFSLAFHLNLANAGCGEAEKKSDIYRAFDGCDKIRAAKKVNQGLDELLAGLQGTGYCENITTKQPVDEQWAEVCKDPVGYVCKFDLGLLFDSKCRLTTNAQALAGKTPDYVDHKCAFQRKRADFIANHRSECGATTAKSCDQVLKAKYAREIQKIESDLAYTPQRIARVTSLFENLRNKFLEKIAHSKRIPENQKWLLTTRITSTKLILPPTGPSCSTTSPAGPSTDVFNAGGEINFCVGAMVNIDSQSDADILTVIGHEISQAKKPRRKLHTRRRWISIPKRLLASAVDKGTAGVKERSFTVIRRKGFESSARNMKRILQIQFRERQLLTDVLRGTKRPQAVHVRVQKVKPLTEIYHPTATANP
jgi:hypothetical protein